MICVLQFFYSFNLVGKRFIFAVCFIVENIQVFVFQNYKAWVRLVLEHFKLSTGRARPCSSHDYFCLSIMNHSRINTGQAQLCSSFSTVSVLLAWLCSSSRFLLGFLEIITRMKHREITTMLTQLYRSNLCTTMLRVARVPLVEFLFHS